MKKWLYDYCASKPAATTDYQPEWEADRFFIGGKMFGMMGILDKEDRPIITLKCDPMEAKALREEHEDIIPGYYMNKEHWITIYLDSEVPDDLIKHCVDGAYQLILAKLSKKAQTAIAEQIATGKG